MVVSSSLLVIHEWNISWGVHINFQCRLTQLLQARLAHQTSAEKIIGWHLDNLISRTKWDKEGRTEILINQERLKLFNNKRNDRPTVGSRDSWHCGSSTIHHAEIPRFGHLYSPTRHFKRGIRLKHPGAINLDSLYCRLLKHQHEISDVTSYKLLL